jgi:hypothetical protein
MTTTLQVINKVTGQDTYSEKICQLVKTIISGYYELPIDSYESKSRVRQVVKLKQASVYFMRKLLPQATLNYIGGQMRYDHATVLHCLKVVNNLLLTDKATQEDVRLIGGMLQLKQDAIVLGGKIDENYYYVGLDKCSSVKLPNGQGIVFSGMLPNQVDAIKDILAKHYNVPLDVRKHVGTGLFILEKLTPKTEDEIAEANATPTP